MMWIMGAFFVVETLKLSHQIIYMFMCHVHRTLYMICNFDSMGWNIKWPIVQFCLQKIKGNKKIVCKFFVVPQQNNSIAGKNICCNLWAWTWPWLSNATSIVYHIPYIFVQIGKINCKWSVEKKITTKTLLYSEE